MQEDAERAGLSDMRLDEINAEIAAERAERRARKAGEYSSHISRLPRKGR